MLEPAPSSAAPHAARRRWLSVLAHASSAEIEARLAGAPALPAHACLRGPETGLVMLLGRAGGGGAAFNLGEMSVTRCSVRNGAGNIGHATVAGRDRRQAELVAALDAAMQDPALAPALEAAVIAPLAAAREAKTEAAARKAAATRVQFFAMGKMR